MANRPSMTLIETMKRSLGLVDAGEASSSGTEDDFGKILKDNKRKGSKNMKVKITTLPKDNTQQQFDNRQQLIYPYSKLDDQAATYRGFPIDGAKSFKTSWKIQIVPPFVGGPPEPLPQFPQQELLRNIENNYVGVPGLALSEKEVMYNSGEAWLEPGKENPTSAYFYTAGYNAGSAITLQKPFPESIYHSVVAGISMPVKVVTKDDKL